MCNLPPYRREKIPPMHIENPDNFTVSISFEYELERLVAVIEFEKLGFLNICNRVKTA